MKDVTKVRKNPYNKDLKGQLPLVMQGPSMLTALTENEEQKALLEKGMSLPPVNRYQVRGVSFAMVKPPLINSNLTTNPQDLLNIEMGQTEVTQELFETVMGWGTNTFGYKPQNPVYNVTWFDCVSFCNILSAQLGFQLYYEMKNVEESDDMDYENSIIDAEVTQNEDSDGFRLPTSKEWEIFAKAGTQNEWAGTNDESKLGDYAWFNMNAKRKTHPVGELKPNEWGLYDMSGNVSEWCWDGLSVYSEHVKRVMHGGTSWSFPHACRTEVFNIRYDDERDYDVGLRICRTIKGKKMK